MTPGAYRYRDLGRRDGGWNRALFAGIRGRYHCQIEALGGVDPDVAKSLGCDLYPECP